MSHQPPTDGLRGTEPARQADDPALSDAASDAPVGPTSTVDDSRPGVLIGIVLLAVFIVTLVAAVAVGIVG